MTDTWGIPGTTFLIYYIGTMAAIVVFAVIHRKLLFRGPRDVRVDALNPQQVAYLNGGDRLDRVAYVHVAGGAEHGGLYHDTHTHAVPQPVLDHVSELCTRHRPPALMLERDGDYPPAVALTAELDAIADAAAYPRVTP